MPPTEIIVSDSTFRIMTPKGIETLAIDTVTSVTVYKRDEVATDLICCEVEIDLKGESRIITLHEEVAGFAALMKWFESLPGFDAHWYKKVVQPPFAENRFVVFRRNAPVER